MRIWALLVPLLSLAATSLGQPQLRGREPRPEFRQALREKLDSGDLDKLKFAGNAARHHEVLETLIARYPGELQPHRRLISWVRYEGPERFPEMQSRYWKQAADEPDDPVALYLAALALTGSDTSAAIRLLKAAEQSAGLRLGGPATGPDLFHRHVAEKPKAAAYLTSFFKGCPSSSDSTGQWLLGKGGDTALMASVAGALRERLAAETDPEILQEDETSGDSSSARTRQPSTSRFACRWLPT